MIPSHPGPPRSFGLFLHLKSGAFGFRFDVRSSHIGPAQRGQAGIPGATVPVGSGAAAAAGFAPRGGQITPSHSRSLHLKSGALGFRFPTRLSHMGPWHEGQFGTADASAGCCCSVMSGGVDGGRAVPAR